MYIIWLLVIGKSSYSQDTSLFKSICAQVLRTVSKDLNSKEIIVSNVCFKYVSGYVGVLPLKGFVVDTSYVLSNYESSNLEIKSKESVCLQQYFEIKNIDFGYSVFLSPYFENFLIVRVARSNLVNYHEGRISALGRNYFYLMKFSNSGRVKKVKKYTMDID